MSNSKTMTLEECKRISKINIGEFLKEIVTPQPIPDEIFENLIKHPLGNNFVNCEKSK